MAQIELTPEELKLIELDRQKKEIARQEQEAKEELEIAKSIKAVKDRRDSFLSKVKTLNAEVEIKFNELKKLGSDYMLVSKDSVEHFEFYKYVSEGQRKVYWEEDVTYVHKSIECKNLTISAYYHTSYEPGFRGGSKTSLKFKISGHKCKIDRDDNLKSSKTIHEKVECYFKGLERKQNEEQQKKTELSLALDYALSTFEKGESKIESQYVSRDRYSSGYTHTFVQVILPNKMKIRIGVKRENDILTPYVSNIDASSMSQEDKLKLTQI